MFRTVVAVGLALLLTPPLPAQMDTVTSWPTGSRVRVWRSSDRNIVGYLMELRGDTLVIDAPGASRLQTRMLTDSAVRLEVSYGRRPSFKNVGIGALGGAALSVATTALLDGAIEDDCTVGGCGDRKPPYGGIALVGAAVGAAGGLLVLEDRWRAVRIPGRVSLIPSRRQTAVALSFAFR